MKKGNRLTLPAARLEIAACSDPEDDQPLEARMNIIGPVQKPWKG